MSEPITPETLAQIRRHDQIDLKAAEKTDGALDETAWERHLLLSEVDRLRTPPPPGELRGLDSMCAALHAATETDPVVKEVAWRTFALIRAHREQSAEVDRLRADLMKEQARSATLETSLGHLNDFLSGVGGLSVGLPESAVQSHPDGGA